MKPLILLVGVMILATPGCGGLAQDGGPSPSPTRDASAVTTPSPVDLTKARCASATGGDDAVLMYLVDVRVATHPGFDRITFEFEPAEESSVGVPKYDVLQVEPPFTYDPSDRPMEVEGERFAHINFQGATGVRIGPDEVEEIYTGPDELSPDLPVLGEAELQGDFEATMSWILGLEQPSCWSVFELSDPIRVVLDLPH